MTAHRIVVHSTSLDLLRAIAAVPGADASNTNLLLGCVVDDAQDDSRSAHAEEDEGDANERPDQHTKLLVSVWEGNELRFVFNRLSFLPVPARADCL